MSKSALPIVFVSLVSSVVACAKSQPKTASSPDASVVGKVPAAKPSPDRGPDVSLDPSMTIAVVNGVPITAGEVDDKISDDMSTATQDYVTKIHDLREQELEQEVAQKLIDLEAKARGMDEKALMKAEIEDKVTPPTDKELQDQYDKIVKPSRPDLTFEQVKPRLEQQMVQQAQQRRFFAFLDELKTKYHVTESLPLPKVPRVAVAATGPSMGPDNAKVTIVEFSDFQCPFCARATESVKEVEKTYGDKVRIVYRFFPLPFHPQAEKAAEAGACAAAQGKFWQMHDAMFGDQEKLQPDDLKQTARKLGMDGAKFDQCLDSGEMKPTVEKDVADGKKAHVNGTPAFFINGRPLSGAQPFSAFKEVIDAELAANK